jgi:hypothetical protein
MKNRNTSQGNSMIRLSAFIILLMMALLTAGCQDSSTIPTDFGTMSLSVKSISRTTVAAKAPLASGISGAAVDSIVINRARLVLRNIRFKNSDDSLTFRTTPMVVELQPTNVLQQIGVTGVPPRTYREIELEVHRVESTEVASLPPSERAQFNDFLAGNRYSIIIEGTIYSNGNMGESFVFRSRINEEQEFEFEPPIVINESSVNVTMLVNTGLWFRSSDGTTLVDPRDPSQEDTIDHNLKSSIDIFEDNDRDGKDD